MSTTALALMGAALAGLGLVFMPRKASAATPADEPASPAAKPAATAPDAIQRTTKGLRNRNPGNLRYVPSIKWRGQTGSDGSGYAVFDSDLNGLRAMYLDLWDDFHNDGLRTVRKLVTVYAPSHENPTNAYVIHVARAMNVQPDSPLVWDVHELAMRKAMVAFENGRNPYPDSLFREARAASGKG